MARGTTSCARPLQRALVAELWVDGEIELEQLERVATVVAPYALIGWDTDGEAWDP